MNWLILLAGLQLQPGASTAAKPLFAPDEWIAEDKLRHMLTSAAVVGFTHAGARTALDSRESLYVAAIAGVTAGIWKEIYDRRAGRPFSKKDLVWDALGIGAGLIVMAQAR